MHGPQLALCQLPSSYVDAKVLDHLQGTPAFPDSSHADDAHAIVGTLPGARSPGEANIGEKDTRKHDRTDDGCMLISGDAPNVFSTFEECFVVDESVSSTDDLFESTTFEGKKRKKQSGLVPYRG